MSTLQIFRRHRKPLGGALAALMAVWQIGQPLQAADFYWDQNGVDALNNTNGTDLGGTGTWDNALLNWWGGLPGADVAWPNTSADRAIFTYAYPTTAGLVGVPTPFAVNVDAGGVTANRLSFSRSGYTVSGGALTLAGTGAGLQANLGESATISSQISGSDGLTKTGGGSIRLTNASNNYTGTTSITNGSLIINSAAALGGTGTVSILTTNSTPLNTALIGFGGGSLVLDGTAGGFTFARDVDFEGRGPIGERGSAILSLGNNTLSGTLRSAISPLAVSPTATIRNSRINSVNGTLTLSGTLNAGGTTGTTVTSLGGVNQGGTGNFSFGGSGTLTGAGSIEKSGGGTLFLNTLASNAGFTGTIRVSASATGQQSSVRVTDLLVGGNNVFGASVGTTTSSAIDLNGGTLEFRSDGNLDFGALSSGKNVYTRTTGIIFTGPAAGGSGVNQTTILGALHQNASGTAAANTTTFNSRNGYGLTFTTLASDASTSANSITTTLTSNMGGNLTFTGNLTMPEGNTGSRPRVLAIGGAGNTVIQGSVIAGTDTGKTLTKSGAGNLTIQGVATTVAGTISITAGAITATDFRSLNNNTAEISLGNAGTTAGNLIIGGVGTPTQAGLTTSKTITLNTTTVSPSIYANQSGSNPVVLNGAITRTAQTTGGLILGGSNTADNSIAVAINAGGTTGGLTKLGAGTWVLSAANAYPGATTIQNGTLKLRATAAASDVIPSAAGNTVVFSADTVTQSAGGTLEFRGFSGAATTETLGALTPTAGASTIRLLGNGGSAANLTFTSLGATAAASSVNFDTSGALGGVITLTGQVATTNVNLPGTANFQGHLYINGADFATTTAGGVVQAPTYGGAGNFREALSALTASNHNKLTGSFTNGAVTVSSLLTNSQTLTLSGNLVVSTGGILQSGGTATIQSDSGTARLIQGGVAGTNVAIRVDGSSDVLNLGGSGAPVNISSTTTAGLTKNGAGTLVINGINAQTGATTINEGTIKLGDFNTPRVSAANAAMVIRQGAFFDLNGQSSGVAIGAFDGAGTVTNSNAAAATLIVGNGTTGAGTFAGIIQDGTGIVNVTKAGTTGAPTWSGRNTYTGVTTIGGTTGLVTVDHMNIGGQASGIGASTSAASNLVFSGTSSGLVYRGSILDGALTLGSRSASTDRLFTLAAAATGATLSSTVTNNNAIVWSNTGAIVNNTTANATLTLTGTSTGDNTLNPQLVNSSVGGGVTLGVSKTAAGQWNLGNSNNTYTGITTLNEGILALNNNGALPTNSPLLLAPTSATSAAIFQMSGTLDRNLAATATAGAGTITFGGSIASTTGGVGFAAHSTELIVAIGGVGTPTALTWGSGGFVGTAFAQNLVLNSTTALSSVDFRNAINLGALARTVNVLDNTSTGADFATMSGVLSGTGGGVIKIGAGILRLTGANTYTGVTQVQAGTLVVSSLGSSDILGPITSSVGAGAVVMNDGNAIQLGAGGDNAGILQYVGAGETSDRKIRFNSTTGNSSTNQIHAAGSGPLILTNVANDMTAGAKSIALRGSNTDGNMITSVLADNGGALGVTVDGGATWILTGANTFTGTLTASGGALGIGNAAAVGDAGTGTIVNNNGNIFAYGADRTITRALSLTTNATNGWLGDYSLVFNGTNSMTGTDSNLTVTTNNSIAAGKTLTFNGMTSAATAARTWNFDGSGETVITGNFTTSSAFGVNIVKIGDGTLTLGTNGATSDWNKAGNALDLDRGTLQFTANNAIPNTATSTGVTISPEFATADTATLNLNGTTQTINALTATTDGAITIDNTSGSAATFRFGANNTAVTINPLTTGARTITDSGAGALSLVKLGTTTTTFNPGMTLTYQGTTAAEAGTFTINSDLAGSTGLLASGASTLTLNGALTTASGNVSLSATGNSTVALTGGISNPNLINSITVGAGSTLSLLDGTGSAISNLTSLNLGAGSGTAILNLNVGDFSTPGDFLNTDTLTLLTGNTATLANTITFNMTDAGLNPSTTYTLLNLVDGGITAFGAGNMIQGATPGGFDSFTWNVTDNLVQLTTGGLLLNDLYWRGTTNNTWNANVNNWSTDKAGATPAVSIPGQGNEVIFAWDNPGAGALVTTLEQNFKVNSLVFEAGATTTPASVEINPGALATARLEIAPQAAADGITLSTGGPAAVTIGANLRLGADQTWTTASGTLLTIAGALFGEADVTKAGDGRVVLSAAADPTFNAGQTATFTVTGGNLEFTNSAAFGTTANSNVASIVVSGGGFYYNNAVAGTALTLPHSITLNGGALSGGGANHVYGGTVNVSGNSVINMADSNTALTGVARNITLSGVVSGSGNLVIDGNNTAAAGNQTGGTLTMNNAGNTWSGDLLFNRGTVTVAAATSPSFTANDVTFNSFGRLNLQGVNGSTLNRTGTLSYAAGAVSELQADNTSAALGANYLVNQGGLVTLGSAGTGATVRLSLQDAASALDITGGVTLGGTSSISVAGGDADSFVTISGIISDGGSGYGLNINDDAGVWAQTNTILRLTGANTFTGNVTLSEGVLEFDTVTNSSGGASALGNGTALTTGTGTLRFIGTTSQSTDRTITQTGASIYSANGTAGVASITYAGAISAGANNFTLTGAAGSQGFITGGITQTGTDVDATVSGGTWTLSGTSSAIADDLFVSGTTSILNLNTAGVVNFGASTGNLLQITNGGTVNLGVSAAMTGMTDTGIYIGQSAGGAEAVLNMNSFNQTTLRLILGERASDRSGRIDGTGILTVDGATGIELYRGTVNANLASTAATPFNKLGPGTVTLRGDNSGILTTTAAIIQEGTLVLDYTANNATKLRAASQLDMRGATLQVLGNDAANTIQTVASFTLASGGASVIDMNAGTSPFTATLNLNAITRAASAGTLRLNLNDDADTIVTTDTLNVAATGVAVADRTLGGWLTVKNSTGTFFARNTPNTVDGSIGIATTTLQDTVGSWLTGQNISDNTGFSGGPLDSVSINSLRFNAATGAGVTLPQGGVLNLASGGILVTDQVTSGSSGILGGTLASDLADIIVTQDSATSFEIGADIRVNSGVTKAGAGALLLSGNNVYTGQTKIDDGTLILSGGNAIGDNSLVTLSNSRNSILQLNSSETIGRLAGGRTGTESNYGTVAIGGNTLTINAIGTAQTYSGVFTGAGTLVKSGTGDQTLSGTSTGFTGTVRVDQGNLIATGNGINQLSGVTSLILNNSGSFRPTFGTNNTGDRINNAATVEVNSTILGQGLRLTNTTADNRTEQVGALTLGSGHNVITAESTGTAADSWLFASAAVNNRATSLVRGTALGSGTADGRIRFTNAPTGGVGTTAGGEIGTTKNLIILPYLVGDVTAAGLGNSFVTNRSATNGLRPLAAAEYDQDLAVLTAGNNTRYTTTTAITTLAAINSLVLDSGTGIALTAAPTGLLTIDSGGIIAAGAASHSIGDSITTLGTASGRDYTIYVTNAGGTLTIGSQLTTEAPLVKSGAGTLILSGVNTALTDAYLNQGVVEIADLDGIGGDTGGLVFAGGTLRLGSAFDVSTDILSTRTISFLTGGGTLDSNGKDPVLAGSLGSGVGGFTKTGLGNLTLNGTATYTGNSVLALGTVTVGANNALGNGGNLTLAAGTTLALGSNSLTHNLVTTGGASPNITGTGTINAATGFFLNHTGNTEIAAILGGSGGLLKAQTNVVTLSGLSTYTGTTEIQGGTISFNTIGNVGGGASALGAPATVEDGVIRTGLGGTSAVLTYTGAGSSSDRIIEMQGTTGGLAINANGTGALALGQVQTVVNGAKTLTLGGTSAGALVNSIAGIVEVGGALSLSKTGTNTWVINGANTYTGTTQIDNGTLLVGLNNALPTGTTVRVGTGATAGTFDLNGFDQTIASLLVQTNSATLANALIVDTGETLTVNGAVTIGADVAASTTLFNATGGGSFVNNNVGGTFQIGGATGATNTNAATADFSGLATFTVDLGSTGTFRVGDSGTGTVGVGSSTLTLGDTSTITANLLQIASGGTNATQTLRLGAGVNTLNVNTLTVGGVSRSSGVLNFAGATGSLILRAADSSSRAAVNLGNSTFGTGNSHTTSVDLTGHDADLLVSTLTMANRTLLSGATTATLSFDQGTLDVTTLNMASRTSTGTGNATATVNLGDSAAPGTPTVTIGAVNMAVNTSGGGTVSADLNVTGGNVTIGTGSGTAINMANAAASRTVTSNITLNGGAVTLSGNIVRTGGAGTETATVTLNGAILDMGGYSLGTSLASVDFVAQAGTLSNLFQLNGGGGLTKTTAGVLTMGAGNLYTGPTILNAGTLNINHANAIGSGALTINGGTIDNTSGAAITLATNNPLNINSDFTFTGSNSLNLGTGAVTLNANRTVTVSANTLTIGGVISGGFNLVGAGNGTLTLTGASDYTGTTTAEPGTTLNVGDGSLGDISSGTTVESGASLVLNSVTYTAAEPLTISGTGAGGVGGAFATTGTSSFAGPITAASHATINASGTLELTGGLVKNGTTLTLAGGGTITISGTGISGANANSDLVVDGTTVNLNVASSYNGPTSILNGGVINANVAGALPTPRTVLTMDASGSGSSNLTLGASQAIASLTGAATSTVNLNGNTLTTGTVSGSTTFAGIISGTGGALIKDDASTLVLSGSNSYTGGTTVSGGTLLVNNTSGSGTGTGSVTVDSGATLGGSGIIAPTVNNASVSVQGLLNVGNAGDTTGADLVIDMSGATGTLVVDLTGGVTLDYFSGQDSGVLNTGLSFNDQLGIVGGGATLNLGGELTFNNFNGLAANTFTAGSSWKLFAWSGLTTVGSFSNIAPGAIGNFTGFTDLSAELLGWDFTNLYSAGTVSIVVIPEPSRAMLLLLGLLGLGLRRRREGV